VNANGYFYFTSGETSSWLDRTVNVPTLSSLTLEQWVQEFEKLKKLNHQLMRGKAPVETASKRGSGRKRAK
jgi:hypothetical protein